MYPYLKEEIYKILTCWNDNLFGPFFSKILDKLQDIKFQKIYMSFYFFIFVFCRLIVLLLFVNFVFFKGDFRYVLYFSPFLFISWFLSFIVYYFEKFFDIERDYIKNLLDVKPINPVKSLDNGIIFTYENNLTFRLTNNAIEEGYTRVDILARIWLNFSNLDLFFSKYKKLIIKFSLFCLFIQIICWITLTITFFFKFSIFSVNAAGYEKFIGIFPRIYPPYGPFRPTGPLHYPSKAFYVQKKYQQQVEKELEGLIRLVTL
jgi:hypothetical protein